MNFSTDRDLLAHEPNVFDDVSIVSQRRLSLTDAAVSGTTLTSASADFEEAQVETGSVVVVDGVALEVMARVDANTLTVSMPRARLTDSAVPPGDGSGLSLIAMTFAPQAALVHDVLLRALGIDPNDEDAELTEDAIVSVGLMAHVETLGTLERVYSGAVAITGDEELVRRAEMYRQRFRAAVERASVLLDTDGDGRADMRVEMATSRLVRV